MHAILIILITNACGMHQAFLLRIVERSANLTSALDKIQE